MQRLKKHLRNFKIVKYNDEELLRKHQQMFLQFCLRHIEMFFDKEVKPFGFPDKPATCQAFLLVDAKLPERAIFMPHLPMQFQQLCERQSFGV